MPRIPTMKQYPLRLRLAQWLYALNERRKKWLCAKFGHNPGTYHNVTRMRWQRDKKDFPTAVAVCRRCSKPVNRYD